MARCGCAGFGACNCLMGGSGSVTVTGSGGPSDAYVIVGPVLSPNPAPTTSLAVTVAGTGAAASPWVLSVRARVVTTGTRPSAVTAGDGMMVYDTTINKPIWSDGAVWRDAAGATA